MGAETPPRSWGRRALALFEMLALVALMGLQGAAVSEAAAGKNRERPDLEQDCPPSEAENSPEGQEVSDDGRVPVIEAIACRHGADTNTKAEADDHEADDRQPDESSDGEPDASDDHQAIEADDHEPDEADEQEVNEGDEAHEQEVDEGDEAHEQEVDEGDEADEQEVDQGDEDHDAGELEEAEQTDDDVEPGAGSGDAPEEEPSESTKFDQDQGAQGTDSPSTGEVAAPEPQSPTGEAGDTSENSHQNTGSQGPGSESPEPDPGSDTPEGDSGMSRNGPRNPGSRKESHDRRSAPIGAGTVITGYQLTGTFSTAALLDGLPPARVLISRKRIPEIAPFIIAGPASWTNTWGVPRFGPGSLTRQHEGQDVFCRYGDPVLASERGSVEYDQGGLGGKVARLHRDDGSYWYYAHLSAWNTRDFSSGDSVVPGDVIGYCGNSGNAAGSPPHVHFGLYGPDGQAINPMRHLVHWLRAAERTPLVAGFDDRDQNRDASGDLVLNASLDELLMQRIPPLDGTGDAFGDSNAGLENPRTHRVLASPSTPPPASLAVVAIATMLLWGGLSVRGAFPSA
jgi:peptidoglycan LD-endopeptidase LytH